VLSIEDGELRPQSCRNTEHYQLTRDFLNRPERFHRYLFEERKSNDDTDDA
jgi:predicted ATPase